MANLNIYVPDAIEAGRALRDIAAGHGYIADRGHRQHEGSASELIAAIIRGELATVLLSDEQRAWAVGWLMRAEVDDPLYADVPRLIAEQLQAAMDRED